MLRVVKVEVCSSAVFGREPLLWLKDAVEVRGHGSVGLGDVNSEEGEVEELVRAEVMANHAGAERSWRHFKDPGGMEGLSVWILDGGPRGMVLGCWKEREVERHGRYKNPCPWSVKRKSSRPDCNRKQKN